MIKNPAILTAVGLAILGIFIVILIWLATFAGQPVSSDSARWAEFGSYLGGTLGPVLAFVSFIGLLISVQHQQKEQASLESRSDSEVYRTNATQNLERAFATFMDGESVVTPKGDRLVWLNVARLILAAQEISRKIEVESIREVYEADEEHWRRRFYEVLDPINSSSPLNHLDYFRGSHGPHGYGLEEGSIRVIYEFCEWPEGREDPISSVDRFSEEELNGMLLGKEGIRDYVRSLRRGA